MSAIQKSPFYTYDWKSLLDSEKATSSSTPDQLFALYKQNLEVPDNGKSPPDNRYYTILRRSLRDLYMISIIRQDPHKLREIQEITQILHKNSDKNLFEDIDVLMSQDLDPCWKTKAHALMFLCKTNPTTSLKIRLQLNKFPDGFGASIEASESLKPYQLYRALHQAKEKAYEVFFNTQASFPGKHLHSLLCSNSVYYNPKIYFSFLISHHTQLTEKIESIFNLFYKNSQGRKTEMTPERIIQELKAKNSTQSHTMLGYLQYIQSAVDSSFFPLFDRNEKIPSIKPPLIEKSSSSDSSIRKTQSTLKRLLQQYRSYPLSPEHFIQVKQLEVSKRVDEMKKDPKSTIKELHLMLLDFFYSSKSFDYFNKRSSPLAHRINLAYKARQSDPISFTRSLDRLFKDSLSKKELAALIYDLKMECVRLYRLTTVSDICKGVDKFLEKIETNPLSKSSPSRLHAKVSSPILKTSNLQMQACSSKNTSSKGSYLSHSSQEISISTSVESFNDSPRDLELLKTQVADISPCKSLIQLGIHLSEAVAYYILTAENDQKAKQVIQNAIRFAKEALDAPVMNHLVSRSIYTGLQYAGITRLKKLFEDLKSRDREILDELTRLYSLENNFANYRQALNLSKRPFIPHAATISSDFEFATNTNKTPKQQKLVRNLIDDYRKVRAFMKFAVPLGVNQTDCAKLLKESLIQKFLPRPKFKREIGLDNEKWKDGEWEKLPSDDKIFYSSYFRWQ